ncbi:MAG: hypothetical protein OJF51_000169 [Nitrospira sp.]|nr:MAG: hypothetical protein OJF51_000169 [Nitrospira sp.]
MLQWGHGISAMESFSEYSLQSPKAWLQWGHGISAMESLFMFVVYHG